MGGWIGSDTTSTEFVFSNGTIQPGPNLPQTRRDGCSVLLPNGNVMLSGGIATRKSVITYDPISDSFSTNPNLINDRWEAGCALFKSALHGNRPVVLAVGGGSATTEVFDYEVANSWEQSK